MWVVYSRIAEDSLEKPGTIESKYEATTHFVGAPAKRGGWGELLTT